jgi:hypothetical protein
MFLLKKEVLLFTNLSFGLRPEEIERNLAQDDEIFSKEIEKALFSTKKRS